MKLVGAILELVGLKKQEDIRAQFAALTARPQFSNFENVKGNNARTLNFNFSHSTAWTKGTVWQ